MPDDYSPAAKRLHCARLMARSGELTLDEAHDLMARTIAMHQPDTQGAVFALVLSYTLLGLAFGFTLGAVLL